MRGNAKHLWFKYKCSNGLGSEKHLINNHIQSEYYSWRDEIFKCDKPIRYPNGYKRASEVAFSLYIGLDGIEKRLDYIQARKNIYVKEYCRLIRKIPEFEELRNALKENKTLIICEIDVPDNEIITLPKLDTLLNNKRIKFGHGLCLAMELLR